MVNPVLPLFVVRRLVAGDIPAALRLSRISRRNQVVSDWKLALERSPEKCLAADVNGQLAATVALLPYGDLFGWIGFLIVAPDLSGRGIGTEMLRHIFSFRDNPPCLLLDASPADRGVVQHLEFTEQCQLRRLRFTSGQAPPGSSGDGVRRMSEEDLEPVLAFDREVFGADRGKVLRAFRNRAPELARVAIDGGRVAGYTFGRNGYYCHHIGPVGARDAQTAKSLVASCLATAAEGEFFLDALRANTEWNAWLEDSGFEEQRPLIRMRRGKNPSRGLPEFRFAVSGSDFG
jgi:GNAT superfamily N-acetyltransferase